MQIKLLLMVHSKCLRQYFISCILCIALLSRKHILCYMFY
ncbi:hypothetical protein B4U80_06519 [Leptotrombidium deliense]|uniref:Uncharacterized protein n=1 Tax=Leptotrombidium deliense TaxID=299467 RepID=A0A443RWN8_9ACAR|nr:hypothetical protein B4U80_06519 [Leptotrombidium deliense]